MAEGISRADMRRPVKLSSAGDGEFWVHCGCGAHIGGVMRDPETGHWWAECGDEVVGYGSDETAEEAAAWLQGLGHKCWGSAEEEAS